MERCRLNGTWPTLPNASRNLDSARKWHDARSGCVMVGAVSGGYQVKALLTRADVETYIRFVAAIWKCDAEPLVADCAPEYIAIGQSGNYLHGMYVDDDLVGVAHAFLGFFRGQVVVYLHFIAVAPEWRDRGIGTRIHGHLRDWALTRDVGEIVWLFDPLVRRNAYTNLVKLGASVVEFKLNVYGVLSTAHETADDSDRLMVRWHLDGASQSPLRSSDFLTVLEVDDDGGPRLHGRISQHWKAYLPFDIEAIRIQSPTQAVSWRNAMRTVLAEADELNLSVQGLTSDGAYLIAPRKDYW